MYDLFPTDENLKGEILAGDEVYKNIVRSHIGWKEERNILYKV